MVTFTTWAEVTFHVALHSPHACSLRMRCVSFILNAQKHSGDLYVFSLSQHHLRCQGKELDHRRQAQKWIVWVGGKQAPLDPQPLLFSAASVAKDRKGQECRANPLAKKPPWLWEPGTEHAGTV